MLDALVSSRQDAYDNLATRQELLITKQELKEDIAKVEKDIARVEINMAKQKSELIWWMIGLVVGAVVTLGAFIQHLFAGIT